MSKIIREIRAITELSKKALESIQRGEFEDMPRIIEHIMRIDTKQTAEIERRFGYTLLQEKYTAFARAILTDAQEAFRLIRDTSPENIQQITNHLRRIAEISEYEHSTVEAEEDHDIPHDAPLYARIVNKEGMKRMKRSSYLVAKRIHELIPALELDEHSFNRLEKLLETSKKLRDTLKRMHKEMGGSGEGDTMVIFRTDLRPQASGIPFRSPLLMGLKESKFWSGTKVSISRIIH
ncbi:hypothetical protein JW898_03415 [Candidatus Woesearchaeota archaeon]|nr:hypothetical protein [Candidatus Woesearchaeota archaeon]